jgi:hypothetical protein
MCMEPKELPYSFSMYYFNINLNYLSLLFALSSFLLLLGGLYRNFVKMLRISKNLYFVKKEHLIDIGKDRESYCGVYLYRQAKM